MLGLAYTFRNNSPRLTSSLLTSSLPALNRPDPLEESPATAPPGVLAGRLANLPGLALACGLAGARLPRGNAPRIVIGTERLADEPAQPEPTQTQTSS
jgi:hypothetical protein